MKMYVNVTLAGLFLVCSVVLQGCSLFGESDKDKAPKLADEDEESSARCMPGGKFSCSGDKKWCAKEQKKCAAKMAESNQSKSCTPQCTWECENKKCDQTCAPKCAPALCSTRCKSFNTHSCKMNCGSKNCKVVCPKHFCPGKDCASCKTECGKPVCKMQCDKPEEQPCRHVCAEPRCSWECKKPTECPKPICNMRCEKPRNCMDNTETVPVLPPLEPGETEVTAFHTEKYNETKEAAAAPAPARVKALMQGATSAARGRTSTMRVNVTTMGKDLKLQTRQVDVELAPSGAAQASWTAMVRKHNGHTTESEASCGNGRFQCKGDASWCMKQQAVVCQGAEHEQVADDTFEHEAEDTASQVLQAAGVEDHDDAAFLQQRSRLQGHLRA